MTVAIKSIQINHHQDITMLKSFSKSTKVYTCTIFTHLYKDEFLILWTPY